MRAGNAGVIASIAVALAGVLIGALAAYLGQYGAAANAARNGQSARNGLEVDQEAFRENPRDKIVRRLLAGAPPERLAPPMPASVVSVAGAVKPKIVIIFDDMGLDRAALDEVLGLPGPVTLSFLPYAKGVDKLAEKARARNIEIMLHLPMEPEGEADPGPMALRAGMTGGDFLKSLQWNLDRFEGYAGVNNHMGSKLTANEAAMKTLLANLKARGLFFLDSVTTSDTVARAAGAKLGAEVYARDVFLDAAPNDKKAVMTQLALVERIARETGYAVAICHPRPETIEVTGPGLAGAPARGFELVTASALKSLQDVQYPPLMVAAPALRL